MATDAARRPDATQPRRRRSRRPGPPLVLPSGLHLRVTPEQFEAFCRANPLLPLERSAAGRLVVMPPAGNTSSGRNLILSAQLYNWTEADGSGKAFDSSASFTFPNGAIISPDAAWVRWEVWHAIPAEEQERFARLVPDFVAETRSPSDRLNGLQAKMRQYVDQGVRLAWLIDPLRQKVEVYRPEREPVTLDKPATLDGEGVLPGFVLDLKGILAD